MSSGDSHPVTLDELEWVLEKHTATIINYVERRLAEQTAELKAYTNEVVERAVDNLARVVNTAFQEQKDYMDMRFDLIEKDIQKLASYDKRITKLERQCGLV
jgi:hypothetical protein